MPATSTFIINGERVEIPHATHGSIADCVQIAFKAAGVMPQTTKHINDSRSIVDKTNKLGLFVLTDTCKPPGYGLPGVARAYMGVLPRDTENHPEVVARIYNNMVAQGIVVTLEGPGTNEIKNDPSKTPGHLLPRDSF